MTPGAEVLVPIIGRKGELARVTGVAAELGVAILEVEIADSPELTIRMMVELAAAERFGDGLIAAGYRPAIRPLE